MPRVPIRETIVPGATVVVDLSPFDRFAGNGGAVAVRVVHDAVAVPGSVTMTVMIGSDVLQENGIVFEELNPDSGPSNETPAVQGEGLPGDPITIRLNNNDAAADAIVTGFADIQNA